MKKNILTMEYSLYAFRKLLLTNLNCDRIILLCKVLLTTVHYMW